MIGANNLVFAQNLLDSPTRLTYHPQIQRAFAQRQCARIAQLVEQRIENPRVGGSIPSPGTTKI